MIYWEDAFQTATYIINRLPTPVLHHKSSFEILYNKIPDYRFMRVFGCACWPNLRPYRINKLNFRSKTCIFIGYSLCHQGYKCLDLSTGKFIVSHNVVFDETFFPYSKQTNLTSDSPYPSQSVSLPQHINMPVNPSPPDLHPNHFSTCTPPTSSVLISTGTNAGPSTVVTETASPPPATTVGPPDPLAMDLVLFDDTHTALHLVIGGSSHTC
jgi:hypothetical protein